MLLVLVLATLCFLTELIQTHMLKRRGNNILELFARNLSPDVTSWGNEVKHSFIHQFIVYQEYRNLPDIQSTFITSLRTFQVLLLQSDDVFQTTSQTETITSQTETITSQPEMITSQTTNLDNNDT